MSGCPVCGSLAPVHLAISGRASRGTCGVCGTEWAEYPEVYVLKAARCPCCAELVLGFAMGLPPQFADARPGDRYCPECDFLIMREFAGDGAGLTCPTHLTPVAVPGAGPGAWSR